MSIQQELLNQLAIDSVEKIQSIQLNNSVNIYSFDKKEVDQSTIIIEYMIKKMDFKQKSIVNVKLLDKDRRVLSNADVYVPVTADVIVKHLIQIKEGV